MNLEKALDDLRTEPVAESAVEHMVRTLAKPAPGGRRGPVWLITATTTLLVGVYAFWPTSNEGRVWASAIAALKDARSLHIRFVKPLQTIEVWRKGGKERMLSGYGEVRYNGNILTERLGFLSSIENVRPNSGQLPGEMGFDLVAFESTERQIERKKVVPTKIRKGGIELLSYNFRVGDFYDGETRVARPTDRYPNNHHLGTIMVNAYVDPSISRIVGVEEYPDYDSGVPTRLRGSDFMDRFSATVDYPSDLSDSMFDPPHKTFNYVESRKQVRSLLKGRQDETTLDGRKIVLKGVLCDGMHVYAVWDGCPGDYNGPDRFKIVGVDLGRPADVRCLSSSKCREPESRACPYNVLGAEVSKPLPDRVDLVLPVFEPDLHRPILIASHAVQGYYSRKVGEARFKSVPVTLIKPLSGFYEREFGLHRHFW